MTVERLLKDHPIVAVVALDRAEDALPLAEALYAEGIRAIEVTLRTPQALDALRAIATGLPEMLLGAGSVRSPEHLRITSDAGAHFAVSPGSSPAILDAVETAGVPFIPGAATATEAMHLFERGYSLIKFFPAEASGGVAALSSLAAPLPEIRFMPTGGINQANMMSYLRLESVVCIGGSWFVPRDLVASGAFRQIADLARAAVDALRE